jgi:hypothetical protein
MEKQGRGADISQHILPTAATMVGVCITVVGIVRFMEVSSLHLSIIDNIVAGDAVLFLASALLPFGALRTTRDTPRLERYADLLFLSALTVLVASSLMLAREIGTHPIREHGRAEVLGSRPECQAREAGQC